MSDPQSPTPEPLISETNENGAELLMRELISSGKASYQKPAAVGASFHCHKCGGVQSAIEGQKQLAAKTAEASDLAAKLQETEKLQGGWTRLQQLVVSYSPKEMVRFKECATKEGGKVVNTWVRFITSVWHERDDLAAKNARGMQEHIKTIEACNQFREQRDDIAAKLNAMSPETPIGPNRCPSCGGEYGEHADTCKTRKSIGEDVTGDRTMQNLGAALRQLKKKDEEIDDLAAKLQRAESERDNEREIVFRTVTERNAAICAKDAATARALAAEAQCATMREALLDSKRLIEHLNRRDGCGAGTGCIDKALADTTGQPILDRLKRYEAFLENIVMIGPETDLGRDAKQLLLP